MVRGNDEEATRAETVGLMWEVKKREAIKATSRFLGGWSTN